MPKADSGATALAALLDGSTAGELIPELARHGLLSGDSENWSGTKSGCRLTPAAADRAGGRRRARCRAA
jgi:hypothetical protein